MYYRRDQQRSTDKPSLTYHTEEVPGNEQGEGPTRAPTVGVRVGADGVGAAGVLESTRKIVSRAFMQEKFHDHVLIVHILIPALTVTNPISRGTDNGMKLLTQLS